MRLVAAAVLVMAGMAAVARSVDTDLLVVGGGASGVAAGVQAARMGVKTTIVEETPWLGGMLTAAGVSAVDGNYRLRAGMWGEFLERLAAHYGGYKQLRTGWVSNVLFEPSVGDSIFKDIAGKEKNLSVIYNHYPKAIVRDGMTWCLTTGSDCGEDIVFHARCVIDATELGDVARMAGVKYDIGMESGPATGEEIAPEKANNIVQDLTYVAILKDYGTDASIAEPKGYDPGNYAACCINPLAVNPKEGDRLWPRDKMLSYGKLPNGKYMINWPIEGNDYYINLLEMTRDERTEALKAAKAFTLGFVYFMQHELGFTHLGLADDEFPTADRLPFIPYHRESRRIHGEVRFNFNHAKAPYSQGEPLYRTNIAVGDYPVDHHHARYTGYDSLPRLYFYPIPSFGLPLGTLVPRDVDNLIVAEKSISVSNIINGTTRLQPVVLQIGTAAGALAALSLNGSKRVRDVAVRDVQNAVLACGGYLQPFLDVEKDSAMFAPLQRIGCTGILKGEGRQVNWNNQTWLRADTALVEGELQGLSEVYPYYVPRVHNTDTGVTVGTAMAIIKDLARREKIMSKKAAQRVMETVWTQQFGPLDKAAVIKRGQYAVLVDAVLDPFNRKPIDIHGNYVR